MGTLGLDVGNRRDQVVVSLRGELDAVSAPIALADLAAAAIRGQSVLLDLTELDFLDCSAVTLLMQARIVAQESGRDVVLANSRGSVRRLLTTLGLAEMLDQVISCGANGTDPGSANVPASQVASDLSRSAVNEPASYVLQTAR